MQIQICLSARSLFSLRNFFSALEVAYNDLSLFMITIPAMIKRNETKLQASSISKNIQVWQEVHASCEFNYIMAIKTLQIAVIIPMILLIASHFLRPGNILLEFLQKRQQMHKKISETSNCCKINNALINCAEFMMKKQ